MMRADKAGEFATTRRPDRRTRLATGALATAALLALVTACGTTEPGPTASPMISLSATPSPTPTATALAEPTKPPEMERNDEVGAVAAAEYFMELHEWVYATGDLTEWDRLSGQTCAFCSNVHDAVHDSYADGGRVDNGESDFTDFAISGFDDQLVVFGVRLHFEVAESTRFDATGRPRGVIDGESGDLVLEVAPSVEGWILMGGDAQ